MSTQGPRKTHVRTTQCQQQVGPVLWQRKALFCSVVRGAAPAALRYRGSIGPAPQPGCPHSHYVTHKVPLELPCSPRVRSVEGLSYISVDKHFGVR